MDFQKYKLTSRVVNDLKKRSTIGIIFYIIVLFVVLFTDQYYLRYPDFSKEFFTLVFLVCVFRFVHLPLSKRMPSKYETMSNGLFFISVALTAMIWGMGFAKFMLQPGEPDAQLLMVMCTIGLCSGGVVAFIPEFRLSVIFGIFMLMPAAGAMLLHKINLALVFAITLFFLYMCFIAKRGNKEYWAALENEHLLEVKSKDLEIMSQTDSLTGLYNRRFFDEIFSFEWHLSVRNQSALSVIICDIDHFKQINDKFGHLAGDRYLKSAARLLKKVFKRKSDFFARYGGEEFIVLLPGVAGENAKEIAEKARKVLEEFQMSFEEQMIHATISMGVSTYIPHPKSKKEVLISKADKALYQSKINGRNKVTFID